MINFQDQVKEFMVAAGQFVATKPRELTTDEAKFRYDLFMEEVEELETAFKEGNRVEVLDALLDIQYIVLGTANVMGIECIYELVAAYELWDINGRQPLELRIEDIKRLSVTSIHGAIFETSAFAGIFGIPRDKFTEGFNRVHKSNMSKFCQSEREANSTIETYKKQGVETYWVKRGDLYVVLRTSDNKVMKSNMYSPVNLEDLV